MKQLTNDGIIKNRVDTINQYRLLDYLKKNLNKPILDMTRIKK